MSLKKRIINSLVDDTLLIFGEAQYELVTDSNPSYTKSISSYDVSANGTIKSYGGKSLMIDGERVSACVTELVSKNSSDVVLAEHEIPEAIKNLAGYGWSAGTVYNEVDFEAMTFTQNVGERAYQSGDEEDSTVITDGTTTYYPLATPIVTDLTTILTLTDIKRLRILPIESGGSVTLVQESSNLVIPNTLTYKKKVTE